MTNPKLTHNCERVAVFMGDFVGHVRDVLRTNDGPESYINLWFSKDYLLGLADRIEALLPPEES